ncbi:uncharacterized protein BJ171DRAFT_499538 [Polychytrium aggregatum]|uniref:uncharacterized protein n=1 Tax=Polychytrium aggregatum TaxID=110093 RepID=UPI0022FE9A9A|nr:uncharacterized protein BJ171DRAFT_499538 [Polychytrium aggregatum]KAI9205753.1 hypothetical protein BJ171DRAFT_499538 [Polychytrium aggregatum]
MADTHHDKPEQDSSDSLWRSLIPCSGTTLALLGTAAFCLPSLSSTYFKSFGMSQPPLDRTFVLRNFFFVYEAQPRFRLLSPSHSWITHMFHHHDIFHFVGNMYAVFSSGWFLDLGFLPTLSLFLGGGIAGAATHILEWAVLKRTDRPMLDSLHQVAREISGYGHPSIPSLSTEVEIMDWVRRQLKTAKEAVTAPLRGRTFALCGASAGAYALMGAELCSIISDLRRCYRRYKQAPRGSYSRDVHRSKLWTLIGIAIGRIVALIPQILAVLETGNSGSFGIWGFQTQADMVGFSAHLGGFAFGVAWMYVWKAL